MVASGSLHFYSRSLGSLSSSPDFLIYTDAEGRSGCTSIVFRVISKAHKPCRFTCAAPQNDQARSASTSLIFALELFTVLSAICALGNRARNASVLIFAGGDSASEVLTE